MKTMDAPETARLLDETLKTLATLAGLDPKVLRQSYAPGKWTAAEIFAHLAFVDAVFLYRFLKAVAEDGSVIVPFDENLWQKELEAATQPVAVSRQQQPTMKLIESFLPASSFSCLERKPPAHLLRCRRTPNGPAVILGVHLREREVPPANVEVALP